MAFHLIQPDVAGGLSPGTVMDTAVHPPYVRELHYEVAGWVGDDVIESFPCFLVSPRAAQAMRAAGLTGFTATDDAVVTLLPGTEDLIDPAVLGFLWLHPHGTPGRDDVAVDSLASLVVSDRALDVLRGLELGRADVSPWTGDPPA